MMKKRTTLYDRLIIPLIAISAGIMLIPAAHAECVVPNEVNCDATGYDLDCPPAGEDFPVKVLAVDANAGCASISGYEGCLVNDSDLGNFKPTTPNVICPIGGNELRVFAWFGPKGEIVWEAEKNTGDTSEPIYLGADFVIVNGAARGSNNCGYANDLDLFAGIGGDQKNQNTYQNVTGVWFCSDGDLDVPPAPVVIDEPTFPLPICGIGDGTNKEYDPDDGYITNADGTLDQTAVNCPVCADWAEVEIPGDDGGVIVGQLQSYCVDATTTGSACESVCGVDIECDANGVPTGVVIVPGSDVCVPPPITFVTHFEERESNLGIEDGEWACFCNLQPSRNTVCRTDVPEEDPQSCASLGNIPELQFFDAMMIGRENPPLFWRNGRCYGC